MLRSHYKADVAGFCKARGHAHPFQTGCTISPYSKKLIAKTIGQSFAEYSFLRELEGSTPLAERGFGTVPAQCPRSARDSARLGIIAVPAVLFFCKRKEETSTPFEDLRTAGTAMNSRRALSRALCGHCAGTARALCLTNTHDDSLHRRISPL